MTYIPGRLDVKTDIQRSLMATYGEKGFTEPNFKHFLGNANATIGTMNLSQGKKKFN